MLYAADTPRTSRSGPFSSFISANGVSTRARKGNLSVAKLRISRTDPKSHVPYSILSKEEMKKRMKNLHGEISRIQKQRDRLNYKVESIVAKQGVTVDDEIHNDMKSIIKTEGETMLEKGPLNSFGRVFWQQQVDAASKKDARGMRWHPLMIRWCIYLRHQSQGAYETLRQSKCVSLPSQRTLRDYTHYIKPKHGFSAEVDSQLCTIAKINQCTEREKHVMLLIDEMHVREDLVFNKHSGELIGFTNMGEINSCLTSLEKNDDTSTSSPPMLLANSMVTFMVKGLFSRLEFPYAYFPCRNITGDLLFDPLWESICRLERCGFKVRNCHE